LPSHQPLAQRITFRIDITFSPLTIFVSRSASPVAGGKSGWINWNALVDESEDADELNNNNEQILPEPGIFFIHLFLLTGCVQS
jgi:hypothetical protein